MPQNAVHIAATQNKWNKQTPSPLSELAQVLYPEVTSALIQFIDAHSFEYKVKKGTHLLKAGNICEYMYFIKKGALRSYIKNGKKEITTWITAENGMITSIRGFHLQQPSLENIQAIEDCELVGGAYTDLKYAYDHFIEMNVVGRRLLESYYIDADERAYILRLPKAELKYQHFIETHSHLANRIPLKYIASFLGITIETLSRIRSKLSKQTTS